MFKESFLAKNDPKLRSIMRSEFRQSGNFDYLQNRLLKSYKISASTTEEELRTPNNILIINKCNIGEAMESFSYLYRLRWVRYRKEKFEYILSPDSDMRASIYKPQNEYQKKRFVYTSEFMSKLKGMPFSRDRNFLSGKPFDYQDLPDDIKDPLKEALSALIDSQPPPPGIKKTDINSLSTAKIIIKPQNSKSDSSISEYWLDINSNIGGFGFRWNDSLQNDSFPSSGDNIVSSSEPEKNESFSRENMIKENDFIKDIYKPYNNNPNIISLLRDISTKNSINILSEPLPLDIRVRLSGKIITIEETISQICDQLGQWEWEISPGMFLLLRSKESPRRRNK